VAVREKLNVLEIGAGSYSENKTIILEMNGSYKSIDVRPETNPDILGSIYDLEEEEKYDVVIATDVFEHLPDLKKAIDIVRQTMKEGGYFFASTPFQKQLHGEEYGDYWRITRQGWKWLCEDFSSVEIPHLGEELFPKAYFVKIKK